MSSCTSRDLTIEEVLTDPLIGAAMRADRVDTRGFEMLLRNMARHIDAAPHAQYHHVRAARAVVAARGCVSAGATAW